jgi:5-hydroxyisourate hydrolase
MAGKLTTHVLDTSRGQPAAGMKISLFRDGKLIRTAVTNRDGRIDGPLVSGEEFGAGNWRLEFSVSEFFGSSAFLDVVPVAFNVDDSGRDYHVPLLVSPWAYSTYRGS